MHKVEYKGALMAIFFGEDGRSTSNLFIKAYLDEQDKIKEGGGLSAKEYSEREQLINALESVERYLRNQDLSEIGLQVKGKVLQALNVVK